MAQFQCPKCGKILEKGIPQCPTCGARFNWITDPSAPRAPAVPSQSSSQKTNIILKNGLLKAVVTDNFVLCGGQTIPLSEITEIKYHDPMGLTNGFITFVTDRYGKNVSDMNSAIKCLTTIVVSTKQIDTLHEIIDFFSQLVPITNCNLKNPTKKQKFKAEEKELKQQDILFCPKCHSQQVAHESKKLSLGRVLVGDALFGATGAVLGGLSSKKIEFICLKCGHRWKLK